MDSGGLRASAGREGLCLLCKVMESLRWQRPCECNPDPFSSSWGKVWARLEGGVAPGCSPQLSKALTAKHSPWLRKEARTSGWPRPPRPPGAVISEVPSHRPLPKSQAPAGRKPCIPGGRGRDDGMTAKEPAKLRRWPPGPGVQGARPGGAGRALGVSVLRSRPEATALARRSAL